jgi:hypothetical protein
MPALKAACVRAYRVGSNAVPASGPAISPWQRQGALELAPQAPHACANTVRFHRHIVPAKPEMLQYQYVHSRLS